MNRTRWVLAFVCLAVLAGCAQKKGGGAPELLNSDIVSDRPQNWKHFIAIVKLKTPALLSQMKVVDGKKVVDEVLKQAVLKEQELFEQSLKKISKDIVVLNRYRMVLNGLAILAPKSVEEKFKKLHAVSYIEFEGSFARPMAIRDDGPTNSSNRDLSAKNSVSFIGADKVHAELTALGTNGNEVSAKGQGVKVGIIDTGIDYTHAMFGGEGTPEAYQAVDPNTTNDLFPNAKVVGGIDLVGTEYDSSSGLFKFHIPKPDANPIDEQGHGSHVAGTVAGKGDGIQSYSGVAPEAQLYAIKVFGADGSTGDTVIVAALEYSADPNGDLDGSDRLDVVNMSLGSPFGKPHILYKEAVENLVNGGTVVVASAGNSGNNDYITGAPASVTEAISVAASIDFMDHNWKFQAVKFSADGEDLFVEAVEGNISTPIADAGDVSGKLVPVGILDQDLTLEQAEQVAGHVALIDRGKVTFSDKLKRAKAAGAIGAIVANHVDGAPIAMGGSEKSDLPAIMVTKAIGDKLKAATDAYVHFQTDEKIEKPEFIDTLTGFSSKGPRSQDSALKPEISAPGASIISAAFGKGAETTKMSGTSMAAPHVAGVMALLKQLHPQLSADQLKGLLLSTAKTISDEKEETYLVSRQGAGRVQTFKAATQKLFVAPTTLSLGENALEKGKILRRFVTLTNTGKDKLTLDIDSSTLSKNLVLTAKDSVDLEPGESKSVELRFKLSVDEKLGPINELDGFVKFKQGENEVARVPVLAVVRKLSRLKAQKLKVFAATEAESEGSLAEVTLTNGGQHSGEAFLFNLLGKDNRKTASGVENSTRTKSCDLQSAGLRVVKGEAGESVLQIGVKLYRPVTTWQPCQVSVLIDADGDNVAEQELAGIVHDALKGLDRDYRYSTLLLDAKMVRDLRAKYEADLAKATTAEERAKIQVDYLPSIQDVRAMTFFNHSTISIIEVDIAKLAKTPDGTVAIKLGVLNEDRSAVEADDYLGNQLKRWKKLDLTPAGQAYVDLPTKVELKAGEVKKLSFTKGEAKGQIVAYFPYNNSTKSELKTDDQQSVLRPDFSFR